MVEILTRGGKKDGDGDNYREEIIRGESTGGKIP